MNGDQIDPAEQAPSTSPGQGVQQYQPPQAGEGLNAFPSPTGEVRNDIEDNKLIAIVSYFAILSIFVLLAKRESRFAQYHAKQGLVLFGATIAFSVLGMILSIFLGRFLGLQLVFYWPPGSIAIFALFILGITNASKGEMKPLPVIGKFAEELNI